jgi:23S rRNA (uracil1939-C5)-methyltransferase
VERFVIDHLGHRGDGVIAAPDGPLYAPFALPGETVSGPRAGDRLTDVAVEAASPHRIAPVCPHFGVCGGCALQNADDAFLAEWKTALVATALAQRGVETEIRPIAVSPPGSRRRVAVAGRRTRKGAIAGFHGRADATLVPVTTCAVADPAIVAALPALTELFGLTASRSGEARASVTVGAAGLDVALEGQRPLDRALFAALASVAEAADFARLSYGAETIATRRPPIQTFGRARVVPPPGGFLQATSQGEAALAAAIREAVGDAERVIDLFAGSGTFALPMAERAEVRAVEGDAAAVAALDAGWRETAGLRRVTSETRDLFRRPLLAEELKRADAVVIDPPRAGAAAQTAQIAASGVRRVAAASCNPATFARDARLLIDAGFRLDWAQPVDQFRWSPHVELAAAFSR